MIFPEQGASLGISHLLVSLYKIYLFGVLHPFLQRGQVCPYTDNHPLYPIPFKLCPRLFCRSRPFGPRLISGLITPLKTRPQALSAPPLSRHAPCGRSRPRPLSTPAHIEPRPPLLRPKSYFELLSHPEGAPQPRASPLTGPRAPRPPRPSLGRQSRSLGPSRRHLAPTPSALRLRSASRPTGFKGTGRHPTSVDGQY